MKKNIQKQTVFLKITAIGHTRGMRGGSDLTPREVLNIARAPRVNHLK